MDLPPPPNPNQLPPIEQSNSFNSIFGSKPSVAGMNPDTVSQINSLSRRVRMMEEAVMNVRRKIEIQEEDSLKADKSNSTNVQTLFSEIDDFKHQLKSFKDDMVKIIRELQGTAKKEDLSSVQKYVELWQPINFVTQKEVASIVDHILDMRLSDKRVVEELIEGKIDSGTLDSTPSRPEPEPYSDPAPAAFAESIRKKISETKSSTADSRKETMETAAPDSDENEEPASLLHAMAARIEKEKRPNAKSQSSSSISKKSENSKSSKSDAKENKSDNADEYKSKIDTIMRRKKELHDLLGGR